MYRAQVALAVGGLLVIVLLYMLPKVVVDSDAKSLKTDTTQTAAQTDNPAAHQMSAVSPEQQALIERQRAVWQEAKDEKALLAAWKPLAEAYRQASRYDSAAYYAALLADRHPNMTNWLLAGEAYYEAFTYAIQPERAASLGELARTYLQKALDKDASLADVQVKIGMTYTASPAPMQGILLIRQVVEKNPDHVGALNALGLLSMQSGQYAKALERFERLAEIQPEDLQTRFYLGICYKELNQKEKAVEALSFVKAREKNPEILATVDRYLQDLR